MYSLGESAKANKLEPYAYLRFLFNKLPEAENNPELLQALLPCYITSDEEMRGI
jgi:transposase